MSRNYSDYLDDLDYDDEYKIKRIEMVRARKNFRNDDYSRVERAKSQKRFKPKRVNKYDLGNDE